MIMKVKSSSRGRMLNGDPNPIDVYVGERIRLRRNLLGFSQEKLADLLGITFQQVQKYERGQNRISASRLWDIRKVLAVPDVDYFYSGMTKETLEGSPRHIKSLVELKPLPAETEILADPMERKETIELVTAFCKLSPDKARITLDLVKSMAQSPETKAETKKK